MQRYERLTALTAIAILAISALAWWCGDRDLKWAVEISEPAFLALGALSIILLWAQLRAAHYQEIEQNVWKRVMCLHEHFKDVPRSEATEAVREYLRGLGVLNPPSAYHPLTREQALVVEQDTGTDERPPARILFIRYLNDWEDFCGAISVGVIDEDYSREMEGLRLIDAFFGYREVINILREKRANDARRRQGETGAPPFVNKLYYELQVVALRWHQKRSEEWQAQEEKLVAANKAADELRKAASETSHGVPPKARDRSKGR
jgi:hypothetical protein